METASAAARREEAPAPDALAPDALPEALPARIRALEGENQRLTLRVKDLQQQLWGRKAERGLATEAAAGALSRFEEALGVAPSADAATRASGPARRDAGARPGPKPLDPRLARVQAACGAGRAVDGAAPTVSDPCLDRAIHVLVALPDCPPAVLAQCAWLVARDPMALAAILGHPQATPDMVDAILTCQRTPALAVQHALGHGWTPYPPVLARRAMELTIAEQHHRLAAALMPTLEGRQLEPFLRAL